MDRPRILHLIDTIGPGGAETVFLTLLERLDPAQWEHHVVLPAHGWLHTALIAKGFAPTIIPSSGAFDVRFLAGVVRLIRGKRIDVVQSHLFMTAVYGSLAGRICGVPVVSTIHGLIDIGPAGAKRDMKFRLLNRRSNRVVLVSNQLKAAIADLSSLREDIMRVVWNGIDATEYRRNPDTTIRREIGVPDEGILVGAVGNIRAPKDYPTLLDAAAILKSRSSRYRIAIIGDTQGESHLYEQLLARRAELGVDDIVRFVGFREDMPRVFNNFDVYVMSSSREGMPLAMLQAMATGIPVVSTRCGGPQELLTNGANGLLVDVRNPQALADAIHTLADDPVRAAELGRAARRRIDDDFTVGRMIEHYESLYREAIGTPDADSRERLARRLA